MIRPQKRKIILISGMALAAISPSMVRADGDERVAMYFCHFKALHQCDPPYSEFAFKQCYVTDYNTCIGNELFLKRFRPG